MPLTDFQRTLLATLAHGETDESYLAGGAAIHFAPNTTRFSNDLDFFHDSVQRVAVAFARDTTRLEQAAYRVNVEISQPGFIRAAVALGGGGKGSRLYAAVPAGVAETPRQKPPRGVRTA